MKINKEYLEEFTLSKVAKLMAEALPVPVVDPRFQLESESQYIERQKEIFHQTLISIQRSWAKGVDAFRQLADESLIHRVFDQFEFSDDQSIETVLNKNQVCTDDDYNELVKIAQGRIRACEWSVVGAMATVLTCLCPEDTRGYVLYLTSMCFDEGVQAAADMSVYLEGVLDNVDFTYYTVTMLIRFNRIDEVRTILGKRMALIKSRDINNNYNKKIINELERINIEINK